MSALPVPLHLLRWIDEHADAFEPPVSNKVVWRDSEFIVMVVRGPNARADFHIDPGDEIFYQLEGEITVELRDATTAVPTSVGPGELLLVPAGLPHAPHRPADSWGLVIERQRQPDEFDELVWYCEVCDTIVHRVRFHLADIETELAAALERYTTDASSRTCPRCDHVNSIPELYEAST